MTWWERHVIGGLLTADEARYVRWYDYLWWLVPIAGLAGFVGTVVGRRRKTR